MNGAVQPAQGPSRGNTPFAPWPGGDFKAWSLIQKEGVEYEKDANGNPILPIFKLAPSTVTRSGREAPVVAKNGPIWKAEKPKE
jgi:hypothetical protein